MWGILFYICIRKLLKSVFNYILFPMAYSYDMKKTFYRCIMCVKKLSWLQDVIISFFKQFSLFIECTVLVLIYLNPSCTVISVRLLINVQVYTFLCSSELNANLLYRIFRIIIHSLKIYNEIYLLSAFFLILIIHF